MRGKLAKQLRYEQEVARRWKVPSPNKLRMFRRYRQQILAELSRRMRGEFVGEDDA